MHLTVPLWLVSLTSAMLHRALEKRNDSCRTSSFFVHYLNRVAWISTNSVGRRRAGARQNHWRGSPVDGVYRHATISADSLEELVGENDGNHHGWDASDFDCQTCNWLRRVPEMPLADGHSPHGDLLADRSTRERPSIESVFISPTSGAMV